MSYKSYTDHQTNAASSVPYIPLVAPPVVPLGFVGEAVHKAIESIVQVAYRVHRTARIKAYTSQSIHALSALDDQILRDIGIQRCEIRYLAREMAENPGIDYRVMGK